MMLNNFNENTAVYNNHHADDTNHKEPAAVLPQRPSAVQTIEPIRSGKPTAATPHLPPTASHSWGPYPTHQLDGFLNGCYPAGNPHQPVYTGVDQYKSNPGKYHTAPPHAHPIQHDYHHYTAQYPGSTIHHPIPVKCNEVCCQHLSDPPRYHPPPPAFQFPPHHMQPPRYGDYHHHHHHHHNPTNGISKQYLYNNTNNSSKKSNKNASSGSAQLSNSSFSPVHSDLQGLSKYSHHYHQVTNRQKEIKQPAKPVALDTSSYPVYPVMNSYWSSRGWVPPPPPYHQAMPLAQYKTKQDSSGPIHCTPAFQAVERNATPTSNMNEERKGVIMNGSNSNNSGSNGALQKSVNDYHEKPAAYRTDCFDLSTSFINSGFPPIVHNSTNKITINNITTAPLRQSTHSQPRNHPCQLMGIDKQQIPVVQSDLQVNVNETSNLAQLETPPTTHCINVLSSSSPGGSNFMLNESTSCNPINYSISNNEMFNNVANVQENAKNYKNQNDSNSEHLRLNLSNQDISDQSLPKKQPDLDVRQFLVTWNDTDEDSARISEPQTTVLLNSAGPESGNTNHNVDDERLTVNNTPNCGNSIKTNTLWNNSPVQARQQSSCRTNGGSVMNSVDISPVNENVNSYNIANSIFNKKLQSDNELCITAVPKRLTPLNSHGGLHPSYIEGYMDPKMSNDEKKAFLQNNNICRSTSRIMHDPCVDKSSHFPFYNGFSNFIREKNDPNSIENAPFYSAFNEPTSQHSCPAIRQHLASWEHINNAINETEHTSANNRKLVSTNVQKEGFERKSNVNVVEPIIPVPNRNPLVYEKDLDAEDKRRTYTTLGTLDEEAVGNFYNNPAVNAIHQRPLIDNSCNFIDLSTNNSSNIGHGIGCDNIQSNIQQPFTHDRAYIGYKTGVICENNPNKCVINLDSPRFQDGSVLRIPQQVTSKESVDSHPRNELKQDSVPLKKPDFPNTFLPVGEDHRSNYNDKHDKSLSADDSAINFSCPSGNSEPANSVANNNENMHRLNPCQPRNMDHTVLQNGSNSNAISSPRSVDSHCNNSSHSSFPEVTRKADQGNPENSYSSFLHGISSSSEPLLTTYAPENKRDKTPDKENNTITLHSADDITTHITVNDCPTYVQEYSEMDESFTEKMLKSSSSEMGNINNEASRDIHKDKDNENCNMSSPVTNNHNDPELSKDISRKNVTNDDNNNSNIIKMKLSNRIIKKKFNAAGLKLKRLPNTKEWIKVAYSSCDDSISNNIIEDPKNCKAVSLTDVTSECQPSIISERHVSRVLSMPSLEDSPSQMENDHASEIGEEIEGLIAAEQNNSRQSLDCSNDVGKELEKPYVSKEHLDNSKSTDKDPKKNNEFEICQITDQSQAVAELTDLSPCQLTQTVPNQQFNNELKTQSVGLCNVNDNTKTLNNILQKKFNVVNNLEEPLESCYSSGRLHDKVNLDVDLNNCNKNKPDIPGCSTIGQIDYSKTSESSCAGFSDDIESNKCSKVNLKFCNSPSVSYFKLNKNNSVESHHQNDADADEIDYDEERLISSVECTPGSPNVEELFEDINKPREEFISSNFNVDLKGETDKSVSIDEFHSKPQCDVLINNSCLKISHDCKINNKESVIKSTLNSIENTLVENDYNSNSFHCSPDCDVNALKYNSVTDNRDSCDSLFTNDSGFVAGEKLPTCKFVENVAKASEHSESVFSDVSLLLPRTESNDHNGINKSEVTPCVKSTEHFVTENSSVITECSKEVDSGFDIDSLCDINNLTQTHYSKAEHSSKDCSNLEYNNNSKDPSAIDVEPNFNPPDDLNVAIDLSKEIDKTQKHDNTDGNQIENDCAFQNIEKQNIASDEIKSLDETNKEKNMVDENINNYKEFKSHDSDVVIENLNENSMRKSIISEILPEVTANIEESNSLLDHTTDSQRENHSTDLMEPSKNCELATFSPVALGEVDNQNGNAVDEDIIETVDCNQENLPEVDESRMVFNQQINDNVEKNVSQEPCEVANNIKNQNNSSIRNLKDEKSDTNFAGEKIVTVTEEREEKSDISDFNSKESSKEDDNSVLLEDSPCRSSNNCRSIIVNNSSITRESVIHDDSIKNIVDSVGGSNQDVNLSSERTNESITPETTVHFLNDNDKIDLSLLNSHQTNTHVPSENTEEEVFKYNMEDESANEFIIPSNKDSDSSISLENQDCKNSNKDTGENINVNIDVDIIPKPNITSLVNENISDDQNCVEYIKKPCSGHSQLSENVDSQIFDDSSHCSNEEVTSLAISSEINVNMNEIKPKSDVAVADKENIFNLNKSSKDLTDEERNTEEINMTASVDDFSTLQTDEIDSDEDVCAENINTSDKVSAKLINEKLKSVDNSECINQENVKEITSAFNVSGTVNCDSLVDDSSNCLLHENEDLETASCKVLLEHETFDKPEKTTVQEINNTLIIHNEKNLDDSDTSKNKLESVANSDLLTIQDDLNTNSKEEHTRLKINSYVNSSTNFVSEDSETFSVIDYSCKKSNNNIAMEDLMRSDDKSVHINEINKINSSEDIVCQIDESEHAHQFEEKEADVPTDLSTSVNVKNIESSCTDASTHHSLKFSIDNEINSDRVLNSNNEEEHSLSEKEIKFDVPSDECNQFESKNVQISNKTIKYSISDIDVSNEKEVTNETRRNVISFLDSNSRGLHSELNESCVKEKIDHLNENRNSLIDNTDYEEQVPSHIINVNEENSVIATKTNFNQFLSDCDKLNESHGVKKAKSGIENKNPSYRKPKIVRNKTNQFSDQQKINKNSLNNKNQISRVLYHKQRMSLINRRILKNSSRKLFMEKIQSYKNKGNQKLNFKLNLHLRTSNQESKFIKNNKKRKLFLGHSSYVKRKVIFKSNSTSSGITESVKEVNSHNVLPTTVDNKVVTGSPQSCISSDPELNDNCPVPNSLHLDDSIASDTCKLENVKTDDKATDEVTPNIKCSPTLETVNEQDKTVSRLFDESKDLHTSPIKELLASDELSSFPLTANNESVIDLSSSFSKNANCNVERPNSRSISSKRKYECSKPSTVQTLDIGVEETKSKKVKENIPDEDHEVLDSCVENCETSRKVIHFQSSEDRIDYNSLQSVSSDDTQSDTQINLNNSVESKIVISSDDHCCKEVNSSILVSTDNTIGNSDIKERRTDCSPRSDYSNTESIKQLEHLEECNISINNCCNEIDSSVPVSTHESDCSSTESVKQVEHLVESNISSNNCYNEVNISTPVSTNESHCSSTESVKQPEHLVESNISSNNYYNEVNTSIPVSINESPTIICDTEVKSIEPGSGGDELCDNDNISTCNETEDKSLSPESICSGSPEYVSAENAVLINDDVVISKETAEKDMSDLNTSQHCSSNSENVLPTGVNLSDNVLAENEIVKITNSDYSCIVENNSRILTKEENIESNSTDTSENKPVPIMNVDDSNSIVIIIEELCNSESKHEDLNSNHDCCENKDYDNSKSELVIGETETNNDYVKEVLTKEATESPICENTARSASNLYEEKQFVTDVLDEFTIAEVEVHTNTYCDNSSDDSSDEDFLGYHSLNDNYEAVSSANDNAVSDKGIPTDTQLATESTDIVAESCNNDIVEVEKESSDKFGELVNVSEQMLVDNTNENLNALEKEKIADDTTVKSKGNTKQNNIGVEEDERRFNIISISPSVETKTDTISEDSGNFLKPVIKCSLPWERVFNTTHSRKRKIVRKSRRGLKHGIELGPAKIELRMGSGEQNDETLCAETSWKVVGNNSPLAANSNLCASPVVKVRRLILQRDPELTSYSEDSACSSKEYVSSSSDEDNKDDNTEKRYTSSSSSVCSSSSMLFEESNSNSSTSSNTSSGRRISNRRSSTSSICSSNSNFSNSSSNISSTVTSVSTIPKVLIKKMRQSEYKSFLKVSHTFNKPVVKLIRCNLIDSLALKNKTSINLCNNVVNDAVNEENSSFANTVEASEDISKHSPIADDDFRDDREISTQNIFNLNIPCNDNIPDCNNSNFDLDEKLAYESSSYKSVSPRSSHSKSTLPNCDITLESNDESIQESALSNYDSSLSVCSKGLNVKVEQNCDPAPSFIKLNSEQDITDISGANDVESIISIIDEPNQIANRGIKRVSEDSSSSIESSMRKRSPRDVSKYMFHCQRCLLVFNNKEEVIEHQAAMHPTHQELHHCMLCQRSFSTLTRHTLHIQSRSHRRLELMQRCTVHAMHRYFTGRDCPRLYPLTPAELKSFDWRPNQPGCIHFYHHPSPLQLALQENPWGMKNKINSDQLSSSSSSSRASSPIATTTHRSSSTSPPHMKSQNMNDSLTT